MLTILYTFTLAVLFASALGLVWGVVHLLARNQLGERSTKSCTLAGETNENCCQYAGQCPEEIRSKCKHVVLKP
ncbi:MAG TPA: hypothetical protein PLX23_08725 [Candidatus Hydrogenedens sp.]|nr:hypothetical protein [Candidatus Hydrogenedens sp.]